MEQSKRTRERVNPSDIARLTEMTQALKVLILGFFQCEVIEENTSPYRYKIIYENKEFEMIFSDIGSFTIRPMIHSLYRKNPSPIFYLSVGKYQEEVFQWEDLMGNAYETEGALLKERIISAIEFYQKQS